MLVVSLPVPFRARVDAKADVGAHGDVQAAGEGVVVLREQGEVPLQGLRLHQGRLLPGGGGCRAYFFLLPPFLSLRLPLSLFAGQAHPPPPPPPLSAVALPPFGLYWFDAGCAPSAIVE